MMIPSWNDATDRRTLLRMGIANYHDAMTVIGMNRIRAGYMQVAPELEPFFVMGTTDDERGVNLTMAMQPGTSLAVQMLASTPLLVTTLDAILLGVILAIGVLQLGRGTAIALLVAAVGFLTFTAGFSWYARRAVARTIASYRPLFPGQAESAPTEPAP